VLSFVLCTLCRETSAFSGFNRNNMAPSSFLVSSKVVTNNALPSLQMSAVADTKYSSGFRDRMKNILLSEKKGPKKAVAKNIDGLPSNLKLVNTLEEYKEVLDADRDKIIVVRFFAKWCKACKAIQPSYYRLSRIHSNLVFVDVPVTEKNVNLHQGLGVPSLPFGHIYHPEDGLVEELKMSKKFFAEFEEVLNSYVDAESSASSNEDVQKVLC